jgi:hypothetical protein
MTSNRTKAKTILVLLLAVMAIVLALITPAFLAPPASAKPAFMDRYNRDPYARAELIDKCTVCHIGRGGAQRNEFGEAFEDAGYRITAKLRSKFSYLFDLKKSNLTEK